MGQLIWNCNFDTSIVAVAQCGGSTLTISPAISGPTSGVISNDAVVGASPSLLVTDVLSLSMEKYN